LVVASAVNALAPRVGSRSSPRSISSRICTGSYCSRPICQLPSSTPASRCTACSPATARARTSPRH
jgi:hypothetical protein